MDRHIRLHNVDSKHGEKSLSVFFICEQRKELIPELWDEWGLGG